MAILHPGLTPEILDKSGFFTVTVLDLVTLGSSPQLHGPVPIGVLATYTRLLLMFPQCSVRSSRYHLKGGMRLGPCVSLPELETGVAVAANRN